MLRPAGAGLALCTHAELGELVTYLNSAQHCMLERLGRRRWQPRPCAYANTREELLPAAMHKFRERQCALGCPPADCFWCRLPRLKKPWPWLLPTRPLGSWLPCPCPACGVDAVDIQSSMSAGSHMKSVIKSSMLSVPLIEITACA